MELTSLGKDHGPRTLLVKDISYNTRYNVIDHVPGSMELQIVQFGLCLVWFSLVGFILVWFGMIWYDLV